MLDEKLIEAQNVTFERIQNSAYSMARLAERLQSLADSWKDASDDYKSTIANTAWDDIKTTSHLWISFIDISQIRMNQLKELCHEEMMRGLYTEENP